MHLFDGHGMDRGFRLSEHLEGSHRALLYHIRKRRGANDFENRRKRPMRGMAVRVMVMQSANSASSAQMLFVLMLVMGVFRLGWRRVWRNHVNLGCGQAAAAHLAHLKARAHVQRGRRFFKAAEGNARVHQGAQQHVAADAGKAL
jgi:hypothetical protein